MKYKSKLIDEIISSVSAEEMLDIISPIYSNSYIGLWLLQTMGLELDEIKNWMEEYKLQTIPQTATWAMQYYEQSFDLPVNFDVPLEQRRDIMLSKKRSRAPMNAKKLTSIIKLLTYNDEIKVDVIENTGKNTFEIKIIPISHNINYKNIFDKVNSIKPAHLFYNMWAYDLVDICIEINTRSFSTFNSFFEMDKELLGEMKLYSYISREKNIENILWNFGAFLVDKTTNSNNNFMSEFIKNIDSQNELLSLSSDIVVVKDINSSIIIERHLWYMDGKYNLDGIKQLDPAIIIEEI